jgi:hypothetical protein
VPSESTEINRHNFLISNKVTMEADCEDNKPSSVSSSTILGPMDQIQQLFASLSTQIETQNLNMNHDLHQVLHENQVFKQEICAEMDELRQLLHTQSLSNAGPVSPSSIVPPLSTSSRVQAPVSTINNPVPQGFSTAVTSNSSQDMQTQMMYMLTESFAKLSSA